MLNLKKLLLKTHSKNKLLLSLLESQAKFSNQYRGIKVKISGRIRGSLRTKKLCHSHGRISTQTIRSSVNSHKKQIFTKWGTWGSTIFISRSS